MLNINNLNRARKILSAQQGIKASFNTPDEKIKFCGKYGPYYKYSFGDVGTEDWNNGDVFSDLPPDKFYESEGGSAYLPPLMELIQIIQSSQYIKGMDMIRRVTIIME